MELRQLRYFVAVAETGNISRAAQKIFLTQPALSRQIKALEEELGQSVLERRAHSVHLTPAGELLLIEARELLARADLLLERVRSAGHDLRLRVGYAPSFAAGILAAAVTSFTQAHPQAKVELSDLSTTEMLAGLEDDKLDIAITLRREDESRGLTWIPLLETDWRLAVGRAHRFAKLKRVTAAEVAKEPLVILKRREFPEYWEMVAAWLRGSSARPRIAGEYDGADSLLAAVEAGLGVAVVTTSIARLFPDRARLVPLSAAPAPLCIHVGYRTSRGDDKPLLVFAAELRTAAQDLKRR